MAKTNSKKKPKKLYKGVACVVPGKIYGGGVGVPEKNIDLEGNLI